MAIKHSKVSEIADGADATLVRPIDWNAAHSLDTGEIIPIIVRKTADETVNNSAVLQNDDHLLFAVAANEVWFIHILLLITTTAVADFKYTFTLPTEGSMGIISGFDHDSSSGRLEATSTYVVGFASDRVNANAYFALYYVGGANAGNIQLKWAQNAAEATNTILLANSCLIAHKIA